MGKFRKKPVVIEAFKFDGSHETARAILQWMISSWQIGAPQPKYSEKDGWRIGSRRCARRARFNHRGHRWNPTRCFPSRAVKGGDT